MPAGNPSTSLYSLGRGKIYIDVWSGTTPPGSITTDVGNCPSFEVEVTEEKLDHYSSMTGTRTKDKTVILETGYTITFVLDEISIANLQKFLKGTLSGSYVIRANTALELEYAIKFVSDNPAGPDQRWEFWRVTLSPNGTFSLIGDDWSQLSFTGEGLSDTANHVNTPYFDVTFITTTTTTTTTV